MVHPRRQAGGIKTALYSRSGGSIAWLAIPSNLAPAGLWKGAKRLESVRASVNYGLGRRQRAAAVTRESRTALAWPPPPAPPPPSPRARLRVIKISIHADTVEAV